MSRYRLPPGLPFADVRIGDGSGQGNVEDGVGERDDEDREAQHREPAGGWAADGRSPRIESPPSSPPPIPHCSPDHPHGHGRTDGVKCHS